MDAHASPQGVILRGEVNPDMWITAGCTDELPVFFGPEVMLSELPVHIAVRGWRAASACVCRDLGPRRATRG
jgi:hypothetical protein